MAFLDLQEHLAEAFGSYVLDDYRGFGVRRVESASEVRERMKAWEAANPERAREVKRAQERKRRAAGKVKKRSLPPGGSTERSRRFRARNPSYYRERRKAKPEEPAKTRVRYLRRKERLARDDNDNA